MRQLAPFENQPLGSLAFETEIKLGARRKVLLPVGESMRALVFLDVRPDRSIVCGFAKKGRILSRTARRRASTDPLLPKLVDSLGDIPAPSDVHTTFHSSGVVNHSVGARGYRTPFSGDEPQQLCVFHIEHPLRFPIVQP